MGNAIMINNWAILVCSSRYWFNYRHFANVITIYREIKRLGIPDEQIIFMNALDIASDSRNIFSGEIMNSDISNALNILDSNIEMDFIGDDANVMTLMKLLSGRHASNIPTSKTLNTNEHSNILIFMSGHGGDEFFKFQDYEEITSDDIALIFDEMYSRKRYNEILMIVDSCQASTFMSKVTAPNIISLSSSQKNENSFAYLTNYDIGLSVIDRFTYSLVETLKKDIKLKSVVEFTNSLSKTFLKSTPVLYSSPLLSRNINQILLSDFFANNDLVRNNNVIEHLLQEDISLDTLFSDFNSGNSNNNTSNDTSDILSPNLAGQSYEAGSCRSSQRENEDDFISTSILIKPDIFISNDFQLLTILGLFILYSLFAAFVSTVHKK